MLHVCVIAVFASLILRDEVAGAALLAWGGALWVVLVCHGLLAGAVWVAARQALGRIERNNSLRPVETLDTLVAMSRVFGAVLSAAGVLLLGTLDVVRGLIGDVVLFDEAMVLLPFVVQVVAGWWATYPVERTLREATFIRDLDEGRPIYSPPNRGVFVWSQTRHQLFLLLVPMLLLLVWREGLMLLLETAYQQGRAGGGGGWLAPLGGWMRRNLGTAQYLPLVLQLLGVVLVAASAPLLIRRVWDTEPLREGGIADGLMAMCRQQGIKVRGLLVWRTGGTMINGAVLGLFGRARYILLTDALLDLLPQHYVKAVMAHEIGHVRRKHVFWLTASLFAASGMTFLVCAVGAGVVAGAPLERLPGVVQLAISGASLVVAMLVFGWVSRRFEWQADAFAVQHLARFTPPTDEAGAAWEPATRATPQAVAAMRGALEIVAQANHLPRERFTFRHGSIATRVERLGSLEGLPLDRFPIDAVAWRIKIAVGLATLVVLAGAFGVV